MDGMGRTENESLRTQVPSNQQTPDGAIPQLEVYRSTTNPTYIKTQCLAAIAVSLGSLIVGFSFRYGFSALLFADLSPEMREWYQWLEVVAPIIGGVLGGPLIEILGRKMAILVTSIPLIISWLLIAYTMNRWIVFVGSVIASFVSGVAFISLRVYLVETTQPKVRGILCLLPPAFDSIAILLLVVADRYLNWLALAILGGTLAVPFLISLALIPESPRWYVSKGKKEPARKALQWLRGKKADVESELEDIVKSRVDCVNRGSNAVIAQLFKKCNLKPLLISFGLIFFQQFSGFYPIVYYFNDIFFDAGFEQYVVLGWTSFAATLIAMILINCLGRKKLLYISSVGMIITLGAFGGYFYVKESGYIRSLGSCILVCYFLSFSIGYGPISWLLMLEILPTNIRGLAASLITSFTSVCFMISTNMFWNMEEWIGLSGCFWVHAGISVIGFVFVVRCVPDTQGKSLEEIERETIGRVHQMGSVVANIQPQSHNPLMGV